MARVFQVPNHYVCKAQNSSQALKDIKVYSKATKHTYPEKMKAGGKGTGITILTRQIHAMFVTATTCSETLEGKESLMSVINKSHLGRATWERDESHVTQVVTRTSNRNG